MFIVAVKTAVTEALRAVWYQNQNVGQEANDYNTELTENDAPLPRRITIEYPEEAEEWPAILVQFRPTLVEWTGISPDEVIDASKEDGGVGLDLSDEAETVNPNPAYKLIRQGRFEGSIMLQVLALSSMERDTMWDNLVKIIMMGDKRTVTNSFFVTLGQHDLVGITVMRGSVRPIGDSMGPGTPWDPELLSYEAAIEFDLVGTFYADEYTEDLIPLTAAQVFEYIAWDGNTYPPPDNNETPPGEGDDQGDWLDPWS